MRIVLPKKLSSLYGSALLIGAPCCQVRVAPGEKRAEVVLIRLQRDESIAVTEADARQLRLAERDRPRDRIRLSDGEHGYDRPSENLNFRV